MSSGDYLKLDELEKLENEKETQELKQENKIFTEDDLVEGLAFIIKSRMHDSPLSLVVCVKWNEENKDYDVFLLDMDRFCVFEDTPDVESILKLVNSDRVIGFEKFFYLQG